VDIDVSALAACQAFSEGLETESDRVNRKKGGELMKGVTLVVAILVNGEIDIQKRPVDTMRECISLAQTTQALGPLIKVFCTEMEGDQLSWREAYEKSREQYERRRNRGAR
jgi:hypothetical protein